MGQMLEVAPGVQLQVTPFSKEEKEIFDGDYPKVVSIPTKNMKAQIVEDWFQQMKNAFYIVGQACKNDIQPTAGMFGGMRSLSGFGFSVIRPDYIHPSGQGRTFEKSVSALTANNWYGLRHNGAIGAAYNATKLYLRKELGIGMIGEVEMTQSPIIEEINWELNGKTHPCYNMLVQMLSSDFPAFRYPGIEYLKPAIDYRCQGKFAAAAGTTRLTPLAIAFVDSEFMRSTACTQPSTSKP